MRLSKFKFPYHTCVIDIGSPKLGNLGWCLIDALKNVEYTGTDLDELIAHIAVITKNSGLLLGLDAPLCVPIRSNLLDATKARKGEGRSPWSAGAGAQVLTMNLPIMVYLFRAIHRITGQVSFFVHPQKFSAQPSQIMIFEALISGKDKGSSHVNDAQIMARSCKHYAALNILPKCILEKEVDSEFFNLAASALLRCNLIEDISQLSSPTPIYKPETFDNEKTKST